MLRRTFLHLDGVGEATERRWWREGWTDWQLYVEAAEPPGPAAAREENRHRIAECLACWEAGLWGRLDQLLPMSVHWRAYGDFPGRILYLDIETAGDVEETITVIGTYDGRSYEAYVADGDLTAALRRIDQYPVLVTFNGARFDLPILRGRFRPEPINAIHIDLWHLTRRLGLRGGLKRIEEQMGIQRPEPIRGLGGWDAVRLWAEYRHGSREALEILLAYNEADTRNLEPLMRYVWDVFRARCDFPDLAGGRERKPPIPAVQPSPFQQ